MVTARTDLFNEIENLQISDRLRNFKELTFAQPPKVVAERLTAAVEAWKETEGKPPYQRYAVKLRKILETMPVAIHGRQLVVGSQTKYFRGAHPVIDYDATLIDPLVREDGICLGGPAEAGLVTPEDWQAIQEAAKFFKGKTIFERLQETTKVVFGDWIDNADQSGWQHLFVFPPMHGAPDFGKVIRLGLRQISQEAKDRIQNMIETKKVEPEKLDFWQSVIIVCDAVVNFSKRYARLAREMAAKEQDSTRSVELKEIAEICEWVPENPARTFHEACQTIQMLEVALHMEHPNVGVSGWGNLDQMLYPYFKKDIDEGRLTLEKAGDLIGCLLTYIDIKDRVVQINVHEYTQKGCLTSISLGGPTRDGKDASNELSYLFLHIAGLLGYAEPHVVIRWWNKIPRWLMLKAIDTNAKARGGVPQFQSSEHIVKWLMSKGAPEPDALDWVSWGCSQGIGTDERARHTPLYVNMALPVDVVLHNGVAFLTGKPVGLKTGDPRHFRTFEEFYAAYEKQVEYMLDKSLYWVNWMMTIQSDAWRMPLSSALMPGCMEKGKGHCQGGLPTYNTWHVKDRGHVPAGDSLIAIKKLVFDEKKLTMDELIHALDTNFEDERGEEIRPMCLSAPKYGNDIDEADLMVRSVGKLAARVIMSHNNMFGRPYTVNRNGQAWHWRNGKRLGALPNGRKAKEPLVDGSLSAMAGMDRRGPTALLKSALKADFKEADGAVLNVKFPGYLFQSQDNREKLVDLTETFFKQGGMYIQYNILDRAMLLQAKKHPERYKDLVVRVGGYSAYFVNLSPEVQDEIIRRTEQSL